MKFLSFPVTSSNASPSFIAYDQVLFSQLAESLPLSVDSEIEFPFLFHITDPLYSLYVFII